MNERFLADIDITWLINSIKSLNELGWKVQYDTLEYGKQNLNTDEIEIDYENKKIIF